MGFKAKTEFDAESWGQSDPTANAFDLRAKRRVKAIGLVLSASMYLASFFLSYDVQMSEAETFVMGLFYFWVVPHSIPWWSNLLYFCSFVLVQHGNYRRAAVFESLAVTLASLHLIGVRPTYPAFYCWVGSMVLLLLVIGLLILMDGAYRDRMT